MPSFKDKVKVKADCRAETTAAIKVFIGNEEYWIPKSQVDDDSEVWKDGDDGELIISEWIATQKGIEP